MKDLIFKLIYFSGIPRLVRRIYQKNRLTILLFHEMPKETASSVLAYLSKRYNIVSLEKYMEARNNNNMLDLPAYPLIITFDDGRKSNVDLIDIFDSMSIKATIYVCANNYKQDGFPLFDDDDFKKANSAFDLQAHTVSHPNLTAISEEEAHSEISQSKVLLAEKLQKDISSFAYPYGLYSNREVALVKAAGYESAVTVDFGFNKFDEDLYRLKRICISNQPTVAETAVKTSGIWDFFKSKLKRGKSNYQTS